MRPDARRDAIKIRAALEKRPAPTAASEDRNHRERGDLPARLSAKFTTVVI